MAPKKRHSTSLAGVPSAAPPTSAVADPDGLDNQKYEMMDPSYRNDCMRACLAHRRGNPAKALKLLKEIILRHPNHGSAHILQSKIYMKLFCDVKDPTLQQKYLKNALDASRRAVSLAPGSLICAMFHAKLLFKIAKDAEGFDEAVRECHRGLNIEFPEGECKDPVYRAADNCRRHLRNLLENIQESRSNPGKTFTDEFWNDCDLDLEDYFRETKEGKTTEVKKMVDQLTDTNRLDQNLSPSTNTEQMDFHRSSRLYKMEEKRKCARLKKVVSSAINIGQTMSYWNTISVDKKQDFLKSRIEDIQAHLSSLKDKLPLKVFSAAVQFAMDNKSWKYWECSDCCEKFEDWDLLRHHCWEKHLHEIPSTGILIVPEDLDSAWIDKSISCPWKPIDTQKALKMMELESKDSSLLSEECSVDRTDADIEESGNYELSVIDSVHETFMQPAETPVLGKGESSVIDCDDREWPFSDDADRAQILDRVKILFLALLTNNYLSFKLFCWILRIAVSELESVIPRALISKFSLYKSPLSICFLETSKLDRVLDSLSTLSDSLYLSLFCEENDSTDDAKFPARERVVFSRDFSSLVLDKRLMAIDLNNMLDDVSVQDDGCAVISETDDHEHEAVSESVDFLTVLLSESTIEDHTTFWIRLSEEKKRQTLVTFRNYQIGLGKLRDIWTKIHRQGRRSHVIRKTKASINEGIRKSKLVLHDLESILLKRRQELGEEEPSEMKMISDETESSFIGEILQGGRRESEKIDQSSIHRRNRSIKETLGKLDTELSVESCITEAKRRRTTFEVGKLELELKAVTGYDYRDFIFPILKCFSRMRLEDLALKNATEKSEAAREALLAELEHHATSSVHKREENKGKKPKKSKEKKRKKNISGAKASKELPEVEEHQSPVTQNVHSALDIQGSPGFDSNPMDMSEEAVLGSAIDEWQEDVSHLDIQFEQIHMSDSSEKADDVIADNLVAGTAPGATEMNFDGNMVSSSKLGMPINAKTSVPKREESKGKRPKKSKNKKWKKHFSGAKASKELPEMEEHQNTVKQNVHTAMDLRGPPLHDSRPMDTSEVGKCEEEDVRQLDNQFKQLEMSDSDVEADGVIADNLAVAQSGLELSGDPPEATRMNFDGNFISSYELGMPIDAKRSLPKREENKGKKTKQWKNKNRKKNFAEKNFDGNMIKSSELRMPIDGRRDSKFKQTQMSEFSDTADILAAGMRLNDYEMLGDSSEFFEMNIERNVISSSDMRKPINDRNDSQIEAKKETDPEFNKQRKPYDIAFGSHTCDVDFDTKKLNQVGLRNDVREYNCFLNVIIQSLWHLSTFQDEVVKISSVHGHTGDPCVICCLFDIFTDLRKAAKKKSKEVVDPSPLRYALSYFCPERNFFQEGRMNDASEVLGSIFHCLHLSVTSALDENEIILREDRETSGSGDYKSCDCLVHTLFVTNIFESLRCGDCDLLSRFSHYTYFFHHLNAKKLRDMKISHGSSSFSELLKLVYMDGPKVRCEPDVLGCGESHHPSRSITNLPRYFIIESWSFFHEVCKESFGEESFSLIGREKDSFEGRGFLIWKLSVLGWQTIEESPENISATLASLAADMDMSLVYEGLEKETKYCLVSLVCCFRWRYVCFGYNKTIKRWFLCEETVTTVTGNWDKVVVMCQSRHFQPQILFFEAVF